MPSNEEFEQAFRERFAGYKVVRPRGETPERPLQESGVTLGERAILQNLAPSPQAKIDWLRQRGYEAMFTDPSGSQLAVRKAGTVPWKVVDERHATLSDILDIGDEVAFGLASGAGAVQGGPVGAGVGGAAAESVRQALAAGAGFKQTPGQVVGDVALSGAVGGATELALGGAGKLLRGALGRGGKATVKPPGPQVNLLEPKARVTPEAALERRLGGMGPPEAERVIPGVGAQAERLSELRGEGYSFRARPSQRAAPAPVSTPRTTDVVNVDISRPGSRPGSRTVRERTSTPGIRHTMTREDGGAIRETTEQLAPRPEQVKPRMRLEEAQRAGKGSFEEASRIIESAPKDAPVYVSFMKKATKKEPAEVRTMRVHQNRAGPRWLSEGEVRKQTSKMPLSMLRELAEEHGPAPRIVKKTYGSSKAKDLDHEGLAKWLFEKQPGAVTERGGPSPKTRKAENIRHQLEQFWEEFGEHTPGKSAEKQARAHLKNLIEGRKESGGYRRFKDIVEVRVGDEVYRFGEGGAPVATTSSAKELAGKVGKKLVGAAGKTPTGRIAKKLVRVAEKLAPRATEKVKTAVKAGIEKVAEKVPEGTAQALEGASETVKKQLRSIGETLQKRGREAAQATAYSLMRKHPELQAWAEAQGEEG